MVADPRREYAGTRNQAKRVIFCPSSGYKYTMVLPSTAHLASTMESAVCRSAVPPFFQVMRRAVPGDLDSVVRVLDLAFAPSRFESNLVQALAVNGRNIQHWLLEKDRELIAYICYSLAYRGGDLIGWHLAPVAVHPEWQRKGYGSQLIRNTLAESPICGSPVFVLGDPAYYSRFGFSPVREPRCPYDPMNRHFMALHYSGHESFIIGYESEFNQVQGSAPTRIATLDDER